MAVGVFGMLLMLLMLLLGVLFPLVLLLLMGMLVVVVLVDQPVKVLGFTPDRCRPHLGFDGETAVVGEAPFENGAGHGVDGVVLRLAEFNEVVLKSTVAFDGDDGPHLELARGQFLAAGSPVGMGR